MEGEEREWDTPLAGQAQVVRWGRRGAGGRLGERNGSAWSRADNRGRSRGAVGVGSYHLKGREEAADRGGGRRARAFRDFGLVLSGGHPPFYRERAFSGRGERWGFTL